MSNLTAHKKLVDSFINWDKVEERLNRYSNIGSLYSLEDLKSYEDKQPFNCHYLAWRMGTWFSEDLFILLDNLIGKGRSLENWGAKIHEYEDGEFDRFWSFLWELQVADMLSGHSDLKTEWMASGPDLKVSIGEYSVFIECYVYKKSYGIESFIEEIFQSIFELYADVEARVDHGLWLKFDLPHNSDTDVFLDELFSPYVDKFKTDSYAKQALENGYVELPVPDSAENLCVSLEGPKGQPPDASDKAGAGDGTCYLKDAISKAVNNKADNNELKINHPNVLAVNFLLGPDFQLGLSRQIDHWGLKSVPKPDISGNIDATWFAMCGIDKQLSLSDLLCFAEDDHPIQKLFGKTKNQVGI